MTIDKDRRTLLATVPALAMASTFSATGTGAQPAPGQGGPTPTAEFAYEALVTLGPVQQAGNTPYGRRVRIPITGGTFAGPRIRGTILPSGEDWQLIRPDGFTVVEASYWMQADDGTLIHIINKGVAGPGYGRTTPWFEAPDGPHRWLNEAVFVGTFGAVPGRTDAVAIRVFNFV